MCYSMCINIPEKTHFTYKIRRKWALNKNPGSFYLMILPFFSSFLPIALGLASVLGLLSPYSRPWLFINRCLYSSRL